MANQLRRLGRRIKTSPPWSREVPALFRAACEGNAKGGKRTGRWRGIRLVRFVTPALHLRRSLEASHGPAGLTRRYQVGTHLWHYGTLHPKSGMLVSAGRCPRNTVCVVLSLIGSPVLVVCGLMKGGLLFVITRYNWSLSVGLDVITLL